MSITSVRTWRALGASVTGRGHATRGETGQDRFVVRHRDDGAVVVAVADGAGSAARGGEGAEIAAGVAAERAAAHDEPWAAIAAAREALSDLAEPQERATTLLVCVIGPVTISAAQVGDGAIVLKRGDDVVAVSPPPGEYLNETVMLTSRSWCEEMAVGAWPVSDVDGVALMTDGLAPVAFDLASWQAHGPFFRPLFDFAGSDGVEPVELETFLASDRLAARTDDDLTLVVVSRAG